MAIVMVPKNLRRFGCHGPMSTEQAAGSSGWAPDHPKCGHTTCASGEQGSSLRLCPPLKAMYPQFSAWRDAVVAQILFQFWIGKRAKEQKPVICFIWMFSLQQRSGAWCQLAAHPGAWGKSPVPGRG